MSASSHSGKVVAVGLSGGVDSAVAAALLKQDGCKILGVIMKIWDGRPLPEEGSQHGCYGPGETEDVKDAQKIADHLNIPLEVIDLADEYNNRVLNPCAQAYLDGTTPNPCVHCNAKMKFGLIPQALGQRGHAIEAHNESLHASTQKREESQRHPD